MLYLTITTPAQEYVNPTHHKLIRYTEDWGRNYKATPEFATAKNTGVVRPSIEEAVKELGYSGPVSITAYGDHKHTPLQALSSTGVDIAHTVCDVTYSRMFSDILEWHRNNPPQTAAIIMLISDNVEIMACGLTKCHTCSLLLSGSGKAYLQVLSHPLLF
ncbi:hypothetical protein Bca4012_057284 [Brassica carinata]